MQTEFFDFHLPPQQIAQEPLPDRDASRLLVLHRDTQTWTDGSVRELKNYFRAGDVLVINDTRVIPARLRATRDLSGGKVEFLLLPPEPVPPASRRPDSESHSITRRVLTKSGGILKPGETFTLKDGPKVTLLERMREAGDLIAIHCNSAEFDAYIFKHGEVPLPPYVHRPPGPSSEFDKQRYQTIYARNPGAVAAPTAGLHFSEALLNELKRFGVIVAPLTLHVGPGTFRPVKAERVEGHFVDPEPYFIPGETVAAIQSAKREARRIVAVGTTSLRTLEGAGELFSAGGALAGQTNLFVHPPFEFKVVNALLTNFHIPKSSLLMLVSAFASPGRIDGIEFMKRAYTHAVEAGYRFYSYGDACLIV
ncbi:MAG TPA: tRNA preQ1(34) S-adenosylmethionine ribosyltransferase-isomerase QueA [Planctomycetota bacterium]|nr:tRNA preQ1(34) S-adenosylmethionine ribosyltransferase-isomerase QueA [Planctomycetota bacterium]